MLQLLWKHIKVMLACIGIIIIYCKKNSITEGSKFQKEKEIRHKFKSYVLYVYT